ncbi:MAG: TlpA family protein disulfide reductase [Burkholderiales bacterium]|nr:TlpA family protein disulfide reductase [Burkholderiales bacterium]
MQRLAFIRGVVLALVFTPLAGLCAQPGQPAPEIVATGAKGPVRLADYRGKVLYVDFWASWCVPCRLSFPWMNEMQAKYEANGLRIVGINVDRKPADAARFLERTPAKFEIAYDPAGNTPRAYGVKAMPSSFLVGPDGQVIATHRGFTEEDRPALERSIRQALKLPQ